MGCKGCIGCKGCGFKPTIDVKSAKVHEFPRMQPINKCHFQILLRGVLGVVRKSGWVPLFLCLLHFYDPIFESLLRGYMRCPPPPPLPPPPPMKPFSTYPFTWIKTKDTQGGTEKEGRGGGQIGI
jgi:hypothetical protein